MICAKAGNDVSFIHTNHTICKNCLQFYMHDREMQEEKSDACAKCPVPTCQFRFAYNAEVKVKDKRAEYSLVYPFVHSNKTPPV